MGRIKGDDGDNVFVGGSAADSYYGEGGDDSLVGRGGNDVLMGGQGVDTLIGGAGDDYLSAQQYEVGETTAGDSLDGGGGRDFLRAGVGDTALAGAGDDRVYVQGGEGSLFEGGSGTDLLDFTFSSHGPYVGDTAFLHGRADAVIDGAVVGGFEHGVIRFGAGDDVVTAAHGRGDFSLDGGLGDDHLIGRAGADTLEGGFGADTLEGGGGDDVLVDSWYQINGQSPNVTYLDGGDGDDRLTVVYDSGTLIGGSGDDTLTGSGHLDGGDGADVLHKWSDSATLRGGDGDDTYVFDRVTYPYGQADTIIDATIAAIDLSPVDADTRRVDGDQAFRIVDALDGRAGELTIHYSADDGMTHVEGDVTGDGVADLVILIKGDHTDPGLFVL